MSKRKIKRKEERKFMFNKNETPAEMLKKMATMASKTGSMEPIGQGLGLLQHQFDSLFSQIQAGMGQMSNSLAQNAMVTDIVRLSMELVIQIMIDKGILTEEEFKKLYKERVEEPMEKHISSLEKRKEAAEQEVARKLDDLQKGEKKVEEENCSSDVVLPSEKFKKSSYSEEDNVIPFEKRGD